MIEGLFETFIYLGMDLEVRKMTVNDNLICALVAAYRRNKMFTIFEYILASVVRGEVHRN